MSGNSAGTAQIEFHIVPMGQLPVGRACDLDEEDGRIVARIGLAHGTAELCEDLAYMHRVLMEQGRWEQTSPCSNPARLDQPSEGLGLAYVSWERVTGETLPKGTLAAPVERDGVLVWLLHEDHASEQLCAEISAYARRIAGDGLWRQHWPVA
ncbi:hypothetical protein [Streptomyces sp. NPDC091416]|uniref:hypothetical protein n=1 Tax=Streptomyces sp. NPDC091416 TaxID=3366003 RepID=UPI00380EF390